MESFLPGLFFLTSIAVTAEAWQSNAITSAQSAPVVNCIAAPPAARPHAPTASRRFQALYQFVAVAAVAARGAFLVAKIGVQAGASSYFVGNFKFFEFRAFHTA